MPCFCFGLRHLPVLRRAALAGKTRLRRAFVCRGMSSSLIAGIIKDTGDLKSPPRNRTVGILGQLCWHRMPCLNLRLRHFLVLRRAVLVGKTRLRRAFICRGMSSSLIAGIIKTTQNKLRNIWDLKSPAFLLCREPVNCLGGFFVNFAVAADGAEVDGAFGHFGYLRWVEVRIGEFYRHAY